MSQHSESIQSNAATQEQALLDVLRVEDRLARAVRSTLGLERFAEAFYFCRVGFVRLNFILGERCSHDERLWVGLARNLWEEAGGNVTPPHNELYRRFLGHCTTKTAAELQCPAFALEFERTWEQFTREAPVLEALFAFAVYEALDAPDYQMLHRSLSGSVPPAPLKFFGVHTDVRHVELFDDALQLAPPDRVAEMIEHAMQFVVSLQGRMWVGLLDYLEAARPADKPKKLVPQVLQPLFHLS